MQIETQDTPACVSLYFGEDDGQHCSAPDLELLLVDWLNALVFVMAARRMLFSRFAVRIDGTRLQAAAWGEPVSIEKHHPRVEVKGATYTELQVRPTADGTWIAQCAVDV